MLCQHAATHFPLAAYRISAAMMVPVPRALVKIITRPELSGPMESDTNTRQILSSGTSIT